MKRRVTLFLFCFLMAGFWFPASAFATCSGPFGNAGDHMYNNDFAVMQYCNGTSWIAMGVVSTPATPLSTLLGSYNTPGNAVGVWGDGTYIYVADGTSGVEAYTFDGTTVTLKGSYVTPGTAYAVWGDGTYIYVADNSAVEAYTFNGTSFTLKGSYAITVPRGVWGDGTYIYATLVGNGVAAFTFNGTTFTLKGSYNTPGNAYGVWGDGTYIYVADYTSGIEAYTFNGTTFTQAGIQSTGDGALGVWGDGSHIFVANNATVQSYTFNGTTFSFSGAYGTSIARSVWGDGTYIYVADDANGVEAYTSSFTPKGVYHTPAAAYFVWGDGHYIYVADNTAGLEAFNDGHSCAGPPGEAGNYMYNGDYHVEQFCNGTNWVAMAPKSAAAGSGSCDDGQGHTGAAGTLMYNGDWYVYQYCDGGSWVAIGTCTSKTPAAFSFTNQTLVAPSTLTTSNIVQLSGFTCRVATSISGAGSPQYRICSDAACSTVVQNWTSANSGAVAGQYVQLELTSSPSINSTNTATLRAGNTDSTSWSVTTCGGAAGDVCSDGSVYAGLSPDGNVPMYTTASDLGAYNWNNGNSSGYVTTSATDVNAGKSNSYAEVLTYPDSDSITAGNQHHQAALACANLNLDGYTDWYLPSLNELGVLYTNKAAIGGFAGGYYWSSTENANSLADRQSLTNGVQSAADKAFAYVVRCVRKNVKRVFITSATYQGDGFGATPAAWDATCQGLADVAGIGSIATGHSFKAWVGTTAGVDDPATRFTQFPYSYANMRGTTIATSWSDLTDGNIDNDILYDETGTSAGTYAWTGVGTDGVAGSANCTGWTTNGTVPTGRYGQYDQTNSFWTARNIDQCNGIHHLYCFEQ